MKKAIRFVIIVVLAFGIGALGKYFGLWFDAEGEIVWIPFVIFLLLCTFGGGWLDRNVLQRLIPD